MYKTLFVALLILPVVVDAQSRKERKAIEARRKADQEVVERMKGHVSNLNLVAQQSQSAGSQGSVVQDYLVQQLKEMGLTAPFNGNYLQSFVVEEGRQVDTASHFTLNGHSLKLGEDYFPLAYSANGKVTGMPAIDLREAGEPWFADVKEWLQAANDISGKTLQQLIRKEIDRAVGKKASALVLYNSGTQPDQIQFNKQDTSQLVSIPVVYFTKQAFEKYCADRSALLDIELEVAVKEVKQSATNVAAYRDNGAPSTVVIATRYFGPDVKSENDVTKTKPVDGEGPAALLELARLLQATEANMSNYLFVAFPGNVPDYAGSRYFVEHAPVTQPINYMVSVDNLGQLDVAKKITIGGAGTSADWPGLVSAANTSTLSVNLDTSILSPGNHFAFYNKQVPVLYFSTGSVPNSVVQTAMPNLEGQVNVLRFLEQLVQKANSKGKVAFTRPAMPAFTNQPALYTVSLGVVPDNGYKGKGFRIGGVTPRRLADKIGLKAGDILLQLGDYEISEMNSYLQALGRFKEGDSTTLKVLRGSDEKKMDVTF